MTIQYNTDSTISGDQRNQEFFTTLITEEMENFSNHITRLEVHVSDENGKKSGVNDIRCLIEARLKNMKPIAVTNNSDTIKNAISGAIDKLKASLETILGRLNEH